MIHKISTTLFAAVISLVLFLSGAQAASTIDPTQPAQNAALNSAPRRSNFQAAYNDLNNIESMFLGTTAPTNPSNLQTWANSSTFPGIVLNLFNAQTGHWVPYAQLNVTTGV